jgi:hypothetical protein
VLRDRRRRVSRCHHLARNGELPAHAFAFGLEHLLDGVQLFVEKRAS